MSAIVVKVNAGDISASVLFASAHFLAVSGGGVGSCEFDVRGAGAFTVGDEITLDVDGVRVWGGYLTQAVRTFPLPVMPDTSTPLWHIVGADYNILFDKRVVRDLGDLDNTFSYAPGTYDDTIINDIYTNFLDVSGDGLTTDINRVAIAILDIPGVTSGRNTANGGSAASQGFTWREVMFSIVRTTGALYYISPSKVFTYTDVETATNSHVLSDAPQLVANGVGVNTLQIFDDASDMRNDALVWGAGRGSKSIVFARNTSSPSVAAHNRWQIGDFNTGIYKQASASTIAGIYVNGSPSSLRGGKNPKEAFLATIFDPVILVGDKVRCVSTVFGYDTVLPVRKVIITTPTPTEAVMRLTCSFDIDAPWSIFDIYPWTVPGFRVPPIAKSFPAPPQSLPAPCPPGTLQMELIDAFDRITADWNWQTPSRGTPAYVMNVPSPIHSGGIDEDWFAHVDGSRGVLGFDATIVGFPGSQRDRVQAALLANLAGVTNQECRIQVAVQHFTDISSPGWVYSTDIWFSSVCRLSLDHYTDDDTIQVRYGDQPSLGGVTVDYTSARIPAPVTAFTVVLDRSKNRNNVLLTTPVETVTLAFNPHGFLQTTLPLNVNIEHWLQSNPFPALTHLECHSRYSQLYLGAPGSQICPPRSGSPIGYQCQLAVDSGDQTSYSLSWPYLTGTTEVWINGTRQRLGIDYDEAPGLPQIVFAAALVGTVEVRVCYVAAGGLGI